MRVYSRRPACESQSGSPIRVRLTAALLLATAILTGALPFAHMLTVRGDEPPDAPSAHDQRHTQYAEARLRLAELDLEKATLLDNRGAGRMLSDYDWRRLRSRIAVLRDLVEINRKKPHGTGIHEQRVRARAAATNADEDLREAAALHERAPSPITDIAVRRAAAKADIARLRLALWDDPENVPSIIDEMQMQIDLLTDHVIDLLDHVDNDRISDALRQ